MDKRFSLVSSVEKALPNPPFIHRNASKLSLGFFGLGRTKEDWHRQISDTAVDYLLLGPNNRPSPHFPWAQLQKYTDSFLKKKGPLSPLQQDNLLIGLVQKHGVKDVAIASCGHAISTQALRHMLQTDLRVEIGDPDINLQAEYLRLILVVDHVNPDVLSPMEVQGAMQLLAASGTTASSQTLAVLIEIMATGMRTENILFYHVQDLTRRSLSSFVVELEQLRVDGKWAQAYSAVQWLSRFSPDYPEVSKEVTHLLDEAFKWHAWARWRPDLGRLAKWDDFFSADQRTTLGHLLALEGPDYLENYATLHEAQAHGTSGNVIYELKGFRLEELESVVARLMQIIDATSANISPADVPLLANRCIGRIVTYQDLELLESLTSLGDAFIGVSYLCPLDGWKSKQYPEKLVEMV